MYEELQSVYLKEAQSGVPAGCHGTIVHVYPSPERPAYEVEFRNGAVLTLAHDQLESATFLWAVVGSFAIPYEGISSFWTVKVFGDKERADALLHELRKRVTALDKLSLSDEDKDKRIANLALLRQIDPNANDPRGYSDLDYEVEEVRFEP